MGRLIRRVLCEAGSILCVSTDSTIHCYGQSGRDPIQPNANLSQKLSRIVYSLFRLNWNGAGGSHTAERPNCVCGVRAEIPAAACVMCGDRRAVVGTPIFSQQLTRVVYSLFRLDWNGGGWRQTGCTAYRVCGLLTA